MAGRPEIVLACTLGAIVLLIIGAIVLRKGIQWWKGRRRLNTQQRLAAIEMEFATDDDDELLDGTPMADDDWSYIDTRADDLASEGALGAATLKGERVHNIVSPPTEIRTIR
mmetsp:Transcript_926/g.2871  ORF Transcript_926/g.2871 Transcript_926/m.2871 type:complete len:112 (-) Transcript_926:641-976(-)